MENQVEDLYFRPQPLEAVEYVNVGNPVADLYFRQLVGMEATDFSSLGLKIVPGRGLSEHGTGRVQMIIWVLLPSGSLGIEGLRGLLAPPRGPVQNSKLQNVILVKISRVFRLTEDVSLN